MSVMEDVQEPAGWLWINGCKYAISEHSWHPDDELIPGGWAAVGLRVDCGWLETGTPCEIEVGLYRATGVVSGMYHRWPKAIFVVMRVESGRLPKSQAVTREVSVPAAREVLPLFRAINLEE